ncbi:MAG: hypothetical protein EKK64_11105 [Neisseriaceae bacterium]|nr:MAG: hypothetical protein EKK64_11105 [Neisseriaceae bacterium]
MQKYSFKNTQILKQIDWSKEIVDSNVSKLSNKELGLIAYKTRLRFNIAYDYLKKEFKSNEKRTQANTLRTLQYFYALHIYYQTVYNNKSIDVSQLTTEMQYLMTTYSDLEISTLPIKEIKTIQNIFDDTIDKHLTEEKEKYADGGFQEMQNMFKECHLEVTKPTDIRPYDDRDHAAILHDGVEYIFYLMKSSKMFGLRNINTVKQNIHDYQQTVKRYHPIIKNIYEFIKNKYQKPIYAMPGGGIQHQIFFGDNNGYITCLYLDLKSSTQNQEIYSLVGQNNKADKLLKDMQIENFNFVTYTSIYGKL